MRSHSTPPKLSERQRQIVQFIAQFVSQYSFPPTIREIGDKVGITSTSVTNYNLARLEELAILNRRRDVSRGLSLNWEKLAEFDIPLAYLSTYDAEHQPVDPPRPGGMERNEGEWRAREERRFLNVPVLGVIAAGLPIMTEPADFAAAEDYVEMASGLFRDQERLYALRVKGNSMIDAGVFDGDIVILRHQETAHEGEMVAVWIEGVDGPDETTLKYFHQKGPTVHLYPANPEYKPIERPADRVQIKGKVVSVLRLYE
jgi:repressor LexA